MKFLRVWVCSRGHEPCYIKSKETKPECPICKGRMSKAKGDGTVALFARQKEVEIEVFEDDYFDELEKQPPKELESQEQQQEEEPMEVKIKTDRPERITELEQKTLDIPLTPKPQLFKKTKKEETKEVIKNE